MLSRKTAAFRRQRIFNAIESLECRRLLTTLPAGFNETLVASGLTSPTALDVAPDGRVFFSDQTGHVRIIQNNVLLATPFADISAEVSGSGERGLLGITLDPGFATNGFVYLYYTAATPNAHNRVSRITANPASPNTMLAGSEVALFNLPDIPNNNNILMGGSIQFGKDGKLLIAVGDQNDSTTSQSMNSCFGKILRINSDGTIPTDNPFYSSTTGIFKSIWALGLRNPFTTAVQPGTGRFFIDDVGGEGFEEIEDGIAGANYGWPTTEGTFNQASFPNFTEPFLSYAHGTLGTAVTGGAFYNPVTAQFPAQYIGKYFFNDFTSGTMYTLDLTTKAVTSFESGISFPEGISVGDDGSMYYLARGSGAGGQPGTNTGKVFKIQYVLNTPPTVAQQPSNTLVSVGQPATFTVSASGTAPLSFQWQRGTTDIAGATSPTYTLAATTLADNNVTFRCKVTNSLGTVFSNSATLTVTSVPPPTATILTPSNGLTYHAGDTINFTGQGTDQLDGTEPASRLTWRVDFQHQTHAHPFIPDTSGITGGSFVIPTSGETDPVQWFRIYLTVTDSLGLSSTTYTEIFPIESNLTVNATVPGAQILLDGQTITLPQVVRGVTRQVREVNIPLIQLISGTWYRFAGWSDGGAQDHFFPFSDNDATLTANLLPASQTFVSSLPFLGTPTNGFGPVELDKSNGENAAGDGHTITLNSVTYARGLGVHAASDIKYALNKNYSVFTSDIGIDDEEGSLGSVVFQVFGDGTKIFDSGVMTGDSVTQTIRLDVSQVNTLELVVTNGGDNVNNDHADWAGAAVYAVTTPIAPAAPSNLVATAGSTTIINLTWTDNSSNETGFKIERSPDGTTFNEIATTAANVATFSDTGRTPATKYYYRVRATNGGLDSDYTNIANATTPATPPPITYLSDLPFIGTPTNGWGPVERDTSNGENAAGDGKTITLNGVTYAKGLGAHANSDIKFNLAGGYTTFTADAGIDDEVTNAAANVIFKVLGDGVQLYQSPSQLTATSATIPISVNVTGVQTLELVVGDANGDISYDHGDWANAAVTAVPATPAAPSGLVATAFSPTQINLSWVDNSTNETGFKIERSTDGVNFSPLFTTAANATTYSDTGLSAGVTYSYRVKSTNGVGDSAASNVAATVVLPAAPSGLTATAFSTSQINLAWVDNSTNETGFKLERATDGVTFTQFATTAANVTTFSNTGLSAGITYTYRVRANNAGGNSAYSNTAANIVLPAAPSGLTATAFSTSQINLAWTDNSSNETGFKIERATDGVTFSPLFTTAANATSYSDTGLSAGVTYTYRVTATNSAGDSTASNISSTVVLPAAPSGLSAAAFSTSQINLSWTDNSSNETGFSIERATDGVTFSQVGTTGANITTFSNTALSAGVTYSYRVRATNTGGSSAASNVAANVVLPAAPTGLTATAASASQINLSWTDNSGNETGFKIERATDGVSFLPLFTTAANATSYSDTGPSAGVTYTYRVRATNSGGDGAASNTASTVVLPAAPSGLSATSFSTSQINLSWTDNSSNETGFSIERATDGVNFSPIGSTGANITTFSNTGLSAGVTYSYRVRATNSGGSSAASNVSANVVLPAAPTGLTATAASASQINLAWADNSSNESGFKIERETDGVTFSPLFTTATNATSYSDTGLSAGIIYSYRVTATNTGGDSAASNTAATIVLPAAPTTLLASPASVSQIDLTWADNSSNETGFKIERATDGVTFSPLFTTAANVTTYSDTGLTSGQTYTYRVRATNAGGDSAFSNTSSTATLVLPAAPGTLVAAPASLTSIGLTWNDNSNNETGFKIERSDDGVNFSPLFTTAPNVTTYTDSGLAPGATWTYRVIATNAAGDSAPSNISTATTPVLPADPSGLVAGALTTTSIGLTWEDKSDNETGFKIERSTDGGQTFSPLFTTAADATSFTDTGLTPGATYLYRVKATNLGGDSGYSNVSSTTTPLPAPPADPSNLVATAASTTSIGLTWSDNSSDETGFKIERSTDGATFSPLFTTAVNVTSYTDLGLTPGMTYTYRVSATNAGGDSNPSNTSTATTPLPPPVAPSGLVASPLSISSIGLTWADNSGDETGFKIERSSDGVTFSPLFTTAANATSYTDSGLASGATWTYRIIATNANGDSTPSNTSSATTLVLPTAPSALVATPLSTTSIGLVWSDNSSNETGFKIERSTDGGQTFSPLFTTAANATTFTNTGLTSGATYIYRVAATNAGGDSGFSNTSSATTFVIPAAPSGLVATAVSASQINLTWVDNSGNETGFKIERSTDGVTFSPLFTTAANVTTYSDTGLSALTPYTYRVRATNAVGDSQNSNTSTATTQAPSNLVDYYTFDEGTGPTAGDSAGPNNGTLAGTTKPAWTGGRIGSGALSFSGNGAFNQNNQSSVDFTNNLATILGGTSSLAFWINTTQVGNNAFYQAPAITGVEQQGGGNDIGWGWIDASGKIGMFVGNTGTIKSNNAINNGAWHHIVFTRNATSGALTMYVDGVLNVNVTLGTGNFTSVFKSIGQLTIDATDGVTRTGGDYFNGLLDDVRIYNTVLTAAQVTALATTPAPAPTAPSGLVATPANTVTINLSWTDNSNAETGYRIERSPDGVTFTQIGTTAANVTTFSSTGLSPGTNYTYRVRATNSGTDSAYSNLAPTATVASAVPAPWTQGDVGTVGLAGSASASSGVFSVVGAGSDIGGTADSFHFVSQTLTGDGTIIARVTSEQNTNALAKAGIMIRSTSANNSPHAMIALRPGDVVEFTTRTTSGGTSTTTTATVAAGAIWLKLVRTGNSFTAFRSADGITYTQLGAAVSITMAAAVSAGLVVCSHTTSALNVSTFDSIQVSGGFVAQSLPAGKAAKSLFDDQKVTLGPQIVI